MHKTHSHTNTRITAKKHLHKKVFPKKEENEKPSDSLSTPASLEHGNEKSMNNRRKNETENFLTANLCTVVNYSTQIR